MECLFPPDVLRSEWLAHGYLELPLGREHVDAFDRLATLHKDPFDRSLLAQAISADLTLVTAGRMLIRYATHALDAR